MKENVNPSNNPPQSANTYSGTLMISNTKYCCTDFLSLYGLHRKISIEFCFTIWIIFTFWCGKSFYWTGYEEFNGNLCNLLLSGKLALGAITKSFQFRNEDRQWRLCWKLMCYWWDIARYDRKRIVQMERYIGVHKIKSKWLFANTICSF